MLLVIFYNSLQYYSLLYITFVLAQLLSCVKLFAIPWTVALHSPLSIRFPSKNTGVDCHFLLQGTFPTQGCKLHLLHLLHWQADSLPLIHLEASSYTTFSSVQFSRSVVSDSLQPDEPQHTRPPCPSPNTGVYPNPCPLSR